MNRTIKNPGELADKIALAYANRDEPLIVQLERGLRRFPGADELVRRELERLHLIHIETLRTASKVSSGYLRAMYGIEAGLRIYS